MQTTKRHRHGFATAPTAGRRADRIGGLAALPGLPLGRAQELAAAEFTYPFLTNRYYAGLADWSDPDDPIANLVLPRAGELDAFGSADASGESENTVMRGVQHKYPDTALVLCTDVCAGQCRYCFRKRLFTAADSEVMQDVDGVVGYVAEHPEIVSVLLTGGDPLTLPTGRLVHLVDALFDIEHVQTVRIGSKMPAFDPERISTDGELLEMVARHSGDGERLYVVCHFDHPRELTPQAERAILSLQEAGAVTLNQCPVVRGVNDSAEALRDLFLRTTRLGCPQYYLFQLRPTCGNSPYVVPIVRGFDLFCQAKVGLSGLSRRARYCMSHASGKIEIVGIDDRRIYARYHRARRPEDENRMLVFRRDDEAYWLDQLELIEN